MHLLSFSPWKYREKVSRYDTTSIRGPISLKFGTGDSGGQSHVHAKVGCVSSMLTCSCSTKLRYRFGGTGILFVFPFAKSWNVTIFFTRYSVPQKPVCKISVRLDTWCIYYHFLHENTEKRPPDMTQPPFILRFHWNLAWETVGVTHTRMQKLCVFRPCGHIVAVQMSGIGLGDGL